MRYLAPIVVALLLSTGCAGDSGDQEIDKTQITDGISEIKFELDGKILSCVKIYTNGLSCNWEAFNKVS